MYCLERGLKLEGESGSRLGFFSIGRTTARLKNEDTAPEINNLLMISTLLPMTPPLKGEMKSNLWNRLWVSYETLTQR